MRALSDILTAGARRCAGLYLWKGHEGELHASLSLVALRKRKVVVEKTYSDDTLAAILEKVPPLNTLVLSYDGAGVIHRLVNGDENGEEAAQVMPGARAADFLVRRQPAGEGRCIISMTRREEIESIVKNINAAGVLVSDICLGPFSVNAIPGIMAQPGEVKIPFYNFTGNGSSITSFERTLNITADQHYSIDFGDKTVSSEHLVSLSLCYDYFRRGVSSDSDPRILYQRRELKAKRILSLSLLPFMVTLFLALAVNFSFLLRYEREELFLEQVVTEGKKEISSIDSLRREVAIMQGVADRRRRDVSDDIAFYNDRIASVVPRGIVLKELILNPPLTTTKGRSGYRFEENTVRISGVTENSRTLEVFVRDLSAFRWLDELKITGFSESKNGIKSFELEALTTGNR